MFLQQFCLELFSLSKSGPKEVATDTVSKFYLVSKEIKSCSKQGFSRSRSRIWATVKKQTP